MKVQQDLLLAEQGGEVEVVEAVREAGVVEVSMMPTGPHPPMGEERRKMGFLAKSIFLNLEVRKVTLVM